MHLDKLKVKIVFLCINAQNKFLSILRRIFFLPFKSPKKILIFRNGSIGDSICALPTISSINKNFPDVHIDILSRSEKETYSNLKEIISTEYYKNYYSYNSKNYFAIYKRLKREKYDLVIQLPNRKASLFQLVRDMFAFKLLGVGSGLGWEIDFVPLFKKEQEKYIVRKNEVERLKEIIKKHDLHLYPDEYKINISKRDKDYVDLLLKTKKINFGCRSIAIAVGANRVHNRWPIENFNEVINYFTPEYNVFLIGGGGERLMISKIENKINVFNFCGELTPVQSALLIKMCIITISNDSGPMHLSYAVGVTVLGIPTSKYKLQSYKTSTDRLFLML